MSRQQFGFNQCKRWQAILVFFCHWLLAGNASALRFELPEDGSTVVGTPQKIIPQGRNTLLDIARHFELGYHEITLANPEADVWVPEVHGEIIIPTRFILPPKPWNGVVINISQRRLFYFPKPAKGEKPVVITYPVSIAREGWSTPLGETTITGKHKDPAWWVPKSIKAEHAAAGEENFPAYFPPGPDNPMGMLAVGLGFKSIFIHGTNKPWGLGMRTSHGCLHLYPENAVTFFEKISVGEPVRVIDEPVVVGLLGRELLMSHYEPVEEYGTSQHPMTRAAVALAPYLQSTVVPRKSDDETPVHDVDWDRVKQVLAQHQALPVSVSPAGDSLQDILDALTPVPYTEPPFGTDANNARPPERYRDPASQPADPSVPTDPAIP